VLDDGVGKVGVQPHAGRQRQRIVGQQSHQDAAEAGCHAGRHRDAGDRHAGITEDQGIDHHDIGHGDESGESGEHFGTHRCSVGIQAKQALQQHWASILQFSSI